MEKAMYPSPYLRITQKDHIGTHADSWAIDEAGSDGGIDYLISPFTGTIKKIYTADANEVWLESNSKVKFADGTEDYMTIMFAHDNNVSNLWVGKTVKQGERFYEEGTKGNATGNHVHIECARGRFTGSGWHQNSAGYWSINNAKKIDECLWVDDSYKLMNTAGYNFKNVKDAEPKRYGTPVARDTTRNQLQINEDNVRARNGANGEILGYMNKGIYNSLEFVTVEGYDWHRVEDGLWFANGTWSTWLPKKEEPKKEEEDPKMIAELQEQVAKLNQSLETTQKERDEAKEQNDELIMENKKLTEQLESVEKTNLIFTAPATDYYAIKLSEEQKLYIND